MEESQHPPAGASGSSPFAEATANGGGNEPARAAEQAAGNLLRFVYTNNPFYVISAALVFWGLRLSFDTGGESFQTGALMASLAGYTLLLAAVACFLIRAGQVWQDVRTILLVIVLMFLAISVSLDETIAADSRAGTWWFLGGLAFAIVVSELVLAVIRLKLPVLFRIPYYLILSLFFLYPIGLVRLIYDARDPALHWTLFGFSAAAGILFLTLLPAVRRGPRYVEDNGSPWQWPLYPWVLFGLLGLGVCGRAYFLCVSFHAVGGMATIFGLYFLVPLLLAANLLLLEIGIVARSIWVLRTALVAPAGLLALAAAGPAAGGNDFGFRETFSAALGGSPLFMTLLAVNVFYFVAMLRRVPHAAEALTAALAALLVCGPETVDLRTLAQPQALPLMLIAALQLLIAWRYRSALCCLVAACCLVGGLSLEFRGTMFTAYRGLVPLHLLLAAVLLIGAAFRSRFAALLQLLGAAVILAAVVAAVVVDPRLLGNPPAAWLRVYPAAMIALAVAYGYLTANRWYLAPALGGSACWAGVAGWQAYGTLRETMAGLDQIAWGIVCLLVAMLISLTKMGVPQRWFAWRRKQN